ncbi:UbiA family prenyltransferase [Litoribacter populi]|uniref:UbiA family prenyltransferase n=1 Tax=Litoribacter populi TaxID=2598460 RepID=UPI00118150EA|nr:UbiA family prenyltransferase [Litoribacter populi]
MDFNDKELKPLRLFQYLSLDVVLGACAGMYFFADVVGIGLGLIYYVLLGLAVWSIYTLDHLMDAKQKETWPTSSRHRFHRQHFQKILIVLIIIVFIGLGLSWYTFQISTLSIAALGLGFLILGNMVIVKYALTKFAVLKEFNIALFYTIGIMLVPFVYGNDDQLPSAFWLLGIGYFAIALLNLWVLSWVDAPNDNADGFASIATALGEKRLVRLLGIWTGLGLIFILSLYWVLLSFYYIHISLLLIMFLVQALEYFNALDKGKAARQRMEASFLLPFLLVVF